MKIAVAAPSPAPFVMGGAENLWWGLVEYINQDTPHQAELIKVPTREGTFWELVESYRNFAALDLTHFDLLISGKYPAWMVEHPNHVCYMLHRLRGLYDTYHLIGLPVAYPGRHPGVLALQEFMRSNRGRRGSLPGFFERCEKLRLTEDVPRDAFAFPGPLAREAIVYLDGIGLAPGAIRKFAAISRTVAGRPGYFPQDASVEVIHPPSHLRPLPCGSYGYLFTASRLDGPKRVHLLVEAMRYVRSPVELKIAGTGPEFRHLEETAAGDPRISFTGFVNDEELRRLYAGSLAVPFVPLDEDYGFITIEAMMHEKPVITAADSGGPNEFVRDGETGFSVKPDPRAIAEKIEYLCGNQEEAARMGKAGRRLVEDISWRSAVDSLLGVRPSRARKARRTAPRGKITVAVTFPVFPPKAGGQSRVFHLYRHLARRLDVDLVTVADAGERPLDRHIAPGLREIRVPKSREHSAAEAKWAAKVDWVPVTDVAMPELFRLTPEYPSALRRSAAGSSVVVACHPYLLPAIRDAAAKPVWYEAQDVEYDLKKAVLPDTAAGRRLLEITRQVEGACCEASRLIMVCAREEGERLRELYGPPAEKLIEVPNGVDIDGVVYVPLEKRVEEKRRLGLEGSFVALFIGSWHGPNIEAVNRIIGFASRLPEVSFLLVGSVCMPFEGRRVPENVGLLGVVDEVTKETALGAADVALNPMLSGTGTNLKMLEYCAAGIPVISTPHGLRGLAFRNGEHVIAAEVEEFPRAIREVKAMDRAGLTRLTEVARELAAQRYAWPAIADRFLAEIEERGALELPRAGDPRPPYLPAAGVPAPPPPGP